MFVPSPSPKLSRRLRGLLGTTVLATAVFAAACSDDASDIAGAGTEPAPAPAPAEVSGNYALMEVRTLGNLNGGGPGLPVTFTDGAGTPLTFKSGILTLEADGTYSLVVDAKFGSTDLQMTDEGSYVHSGNSVDFSSTSEFPRMFTAEFDGDMMTAQSNFAGIPFEIDLLKQ